MALITVEVMEKDGRRGRRRKREVPLTRGLEANAPRVVFPLMNTGNVQWSP